MYNYPQGGVSVELRTCTKCGTTEPHTEFYKDRGVCRPCTRAQQRAYRSRRPDFHRNHNLKQRYGITIEDFESIISQQNFACAICEVEISHALDYKSGKSVAVDHNHETGEVRGILCSKCNLILGHARESTDILYRSILYLSERGSYTPKK